MIRQKLKEADIGHVIRRQLGLHRSCSNIRDVAIIEAPDGIANWTVAFLHRREIERTPEEAWRVVRAMQASCDCDFDNG